MTLLRLLSGRDPQDEEQLRELMLHPPRYFNARLSPSVERIIQTAAAPRLGDRYASIDDS
jgi:hypothetical protein